MNSLLTLICAFISGFCLAVGVFYHPPVDGDLMLKLADEINSLEDQLLECTKTKSSLAYKFYSLPKEMPNHKTVELETAREMFHGAMRDPFQPPVTR